MVWLTGTVRMLWQGLPGVLAVIACLSALAQQPDSFPALTPPQRAQILWEAGYAMHVSGDYDGAIAAFRASISAQPTAEAHTFLGWTLSHTGNIAEAIAQCEIAIGIDPDFGNPYNDIGVYLLELKRPLEAVPWLEKAIASRRYCCYEFPHYNLGRVMLEQGRIAEAARAFEASIKANPDYLPARLALEYLKAAKLLGL